MNNFSLWSRKLGLVMLLLACLSLGAWFRSFSVIDFVNFPRNDRVFRVMSYQGLISITRLTGVDQTESLGPDYTESGWRSRGHVRDAMTGMTHPFLLPPYTVYQVTPQFEQNWNPFRFADGTDRRDPQKRQTDIQFPHWSIFIPLTVLAIYLLLRKERSGQTINPIHTGEIES